MERERNKIKLKVKSKKLTGTDRYLSIILKVVGFIFISVAGYYFIYDQVGELIAKIISFLTASDASIVKTVTGIPWESLSYLSISHIIGISSLIWTVYFSKTHTTKAFVIALSIIIGMTFINTIIYFYWFFIIWTLPYYNYSIASVFLAVTLIVFFISYIHYKKQALLIAISVYFYVFMFSMLGDSLNENRYLYVLSTISIFNVLLFFISKRDKPFLSILINGIFTYGFLMILVLKKFVYNINVSYVSLVITVSFLYFASFYLMTLYYNIKQKKNVFLVFNVLNTIIYVALNGYILSIFGNLNYLFIVFFVSLVVHILSIIGFNKFFSLETNLNTTETISIVLISATLSLIFKDYYLSLFLGIISTLLLFYAKHNKSRDFIKFFMISLISLLINFLYLSIDNYFLITSSSESSRLGIFKTLFVNIFIVLFTVFLVRKIIINSTLDGTQNWFNRRKYILLLNIALSITIFISLELLTFWIMFSTIYEIVFLKRILMLVCGFFILLIMRNEDSFSKVLKKWIYLPIHLFSIFLFFQIYINFSFSSIEYVFNKNLILIEVVLHYVELFLAITIFIISFKKLYSSDNKTYKHLIQFFVFTLCLIVTIIFCKEFDYVSILTSDLGSGILGKDKYQMILKSNAVLPYSLIILFCFSIVLILGVKFKSLFLRVLSILFIFLDLIKIFFIEFNNISDDYKGVIFVVIGILLVLISWFYNKTLQKKRQRVVRKNS